MKAAKMLFAGISKTNSNLKKPVITPPLPFPPRQKCKLQFAKAAAQVSEITEITLLFL